MYKIFKISMAKHNFGLFVFLGLVLLSQIVFAQDDKRLLFNFKVGQKFEKEIFVSSTAALKRGNQTLNVGTETSLIKTYTVTAATDKGYTINMKIAKMKNVVDALGKKLAYDSKETIDTGSQIKKALAFMVNKPVEVNIDKYGVILASTKTKSELATDTLVSFSGVQAETFDKGTLLNFLADFTYNKTIQKGYAWTDSVVLDKQELISKFVIEDINENFTIIKFSSQIRGKMMNSNSNGTYILNNKLGLIVEKIVYSISTGYQISAGRVIYGASRSTSISEKCKMLPNN